MKPRRDTGDAVPDHLGQSGHQAAAMKPRRDDGDDSGVGQASGDLHVGAAMKPRRDDGDDLRAMASLNQMRTAAMKPRRDDGDDRLRPFGPRMG